MMNDVQLAQQNEGPSAGSGYQTEAVLYSGGTIDSPAPSTIANMDRYDYMNMLAESRIVDIAWIQ